MIVAAEKKDFGELLDFENRVFKIDFSKKVGKIYSYPETAALHGIFREKGKIAGAVLVAPGKLVLPSGNLITAGIGSVAVAKSQRGKGIMNELMLYALKKSNELGADIGVLSGYRGRYERYGYVPCAIRYNAEISDHFLLRHKAEKSFEFQKPEGKSALKEIETLHSSLPAFHERESEKLFSILSTWNSEPLLVLDESGKTAGYLIFKGDEKAVSELVLKNSDDVSDVLFAFGKAKKLKSGFHLWISPFQPELLRKVLLFAEHYSIETAASIKFFNYKNVVEKLFSFRQNLSPLPDGSLVLKLGEETLEVTLKNGSVSVSETAKEPELSFSEREATLLLTRPEAAQSSNALFNAWSPLCPFGIFSADKV